MTECLCCARAAPGAAARTEAEWRARLTPEAFAVLRENASEPAFSHPYHAESGPGTYHCAGCDAPVYEAARKYPTATGWPAFDRAIPGRVVEGPDPYQGARLTEVRCAACGGHLGHVFDDGPAATTGRRHCVNGHALWLRAG